MLSYSQLYLDLLAETNPAKLAWLRRFGTLGPVLAAIEEEAIALEEQLSRRLGAMAISDSSRRGEQACRAVVRQLADLAKLPAP